jgi:hypothetical protein
MTSVALISSALTVAAFYYGYVFLCLRRENAFKNCFLEVSRELLNTSNAEDEEELKVVESLLGAVDDPVLAQDAERLFREILRDSLPENGPSALCKISCSKILVFSAVGNLFFGALFSRPWSVFKVSVALILKGNLGLLLALYGRPRDSKECVKGFLSRDRETRARIGKEIHHVTQRHQHAA